MPNLIPRRRSKKDRARRAAGTASSAAVTFVKARVAWLAGKKAARVAAPALAVGTVALVARKRSHGAQAPTAA